MSSGGTTVQIYPLDIAIEKRARQLAEQAAEECVKILRSNPTTIKSGVYNAGWKWEALNNNTMIVFNDGDNRTLTHLLEHGHAIVHYGKPVGVSPAIPHIRPAFNTVKKKFLKDLKKIDLI